MGEDLARVEQLHGRFNRAIEKVEALPEIGISNDGQPFIREVAEALQSFADWFFNLTLEDMSLSGSARRVHAALNALDAIADWVGLNQSQHFATDIRKHVDELVEESEALDAAVLDAFTVKKTPSEVHRSKLRHVPEAKRDAIEDRIQSVAILAGHLGVRLQRIAIMAGSPATTDSAAASPASPSLAREKRKSRKGMGGRRRKGSPVNELHTLRAKYEARCRRLKKKPDPLKQWLCDWGTANDMLYADAELIWKRENTRIRRAGKQ